MADAAIQNESKRGAKKQQIAILRELVSKEPNDIEARLFLALAREDGYDDKGEPKKGEREAIAILEGILHDSPNDSATNHYWIHAIEPGNHPERAIQSAALLASLAPTSGHMVHMPGHIYYRVGDYPAAERWFSASMAADEHYMQTQNVGPDDDWNYAHNMMYSIANLMEQGRLSDANALSDHLAAARGQLSASLYIWSARDQMARISRRLPVALRVGDWDAVLTMLNDANLPKGDKSANLRFFTAELTDYAKGMKALEAGDTVAAQDDSTSLDAGLAQMKEMQTVLGQNGDSKKKEDKAGGPMDAGFSRCSAGADYEIAQYCVDGTARGSTCRASQIESGEEALCRCCETGEEDRISRAAVLYPTGRRDGGRGAAESEGLQRCGDGI